MDGRVAAGCMTGTSIDGLDVALVEINGRGLGICASIKRCMSFPLGRLAVRLRRMAQGCPMRAKEIAAIAHELGLLHLKALKELICGDKVDLIAVHGQTIFHDPPLSWQLINPATVAYGLGIPVITDFRAADLALGGQGAPITPIADFLLFSSMIESRSIVNLGGFCNLTLLPKISKNRRGNLHTFIKKIRGQDVCACNQLLDSIARASFNMPFDRDGKHASIGNIKTKPFESLVYSLEIQSKGKRSLGTDDGLAAWFKRYRKGYSPEDLARSACAAIALTIVHRSEAADRIILAGGGVKNHTLVEEIRHYSNAPVELSDERGVPATHREAVAMAILGALCQDRVPITIPEITGVGFSPISGAWIKP